MNSEKNSTIAKRYANSLFEITKNNEISKETMLNDLKNVEAILKSSDDLYSVMINPIISAKDKEEIINSVFEKDTSKVTRNALKLLIEKNRFNLIYSIVEIFSDLVDKLNNTVKVNITCAIELNAKKKQEIQSKLKEKLNKIVNVDYNIDENILAGLIYKIEDDVIDTSLIHKLEEIKKEIIK